MTQNVFYTRLVDAKEIGAVLKIGTTKWWQEMKEEIYPQSIKLGRRCTRWNKKDVDELMSTGVCPHGKKTWSFIRHLFGIGNVFEEVRNGAAE